MPGKRERERGRGRSPSHNARMATRPRHQTSGDIIYRLCSRGSRRAAVAVTKGSLSPSSSPPRPLPLASASLPLPPDPARDVVKFPKSRTHITTTISAPPVPPLLPPLPPPTTTMGTHCQHRHRHSRMPKVARIRRSSSCHPDART